MAWKWIVRNVIHKRRYKPIIVVQIWQVIYNSVSLITFNIRANPISKV